jgi:hypothetical protein
MNPYATPEERAHLRAMVEQCRDDDTRRIGQWVLEACLALLDQIDPPVKAPK